MDTHDRPSMTRDESQPRSSRLLPRGAADALGRLLGFLLGSSTVMGCSPATIAPADGGSGSSGNLDLAAISQACKDYAYARCTRLETCSGTQLLFQYGDVATCETLQYDTCETAEKAPGSSASVATRKDCTAAISSWSCSDFIFGANAPPACTISPGELAEGAACAVAAQCKSAWCARPLGAACGACAPAPKAGAPCQLGSQCQSGYSCVNGRTCTPHAPLGAACGAAQPCNDGLTCVGGICASAVSTAGASCSTLGAGCDVYAGLACNGATGVCETLTVASAGQACGTVQNQNQGCRAGACVHGICAGAALLGAACDLAAGPACIASTACVVSTDGGTSGTCKIPGVGCY